MPTDTPSIHGDIDFPHRWTVFAPLDRDQACLEVASLNTVPEQITCGGTTITAHQETPMRNQLDLAPFFGKPHQDATLGKTAYVFVPLTTNEPGTVTLGMGGDCWLQAWVNGRLVVGANGGENTAFPPSIRDHVVHVELHAGTNVLAVRLVAGKGASILALGGPRELRAGDFRSIIEDPFNTDPRWSAPGLGAAPGDKPPLDIGNRRELFVDEVLIDRMTGGAERRLHHPVPREIVFRAGREGEPWEGNTGYPTLFRDADRIRMYYSGRPATVADQSKEQYTCVAESEDGIRFTRPDLGLHEFNGSTHNNIIWHGTPSHNFSPFKDPNPDTPEDQRYKAIAYYTAGGGLGVYASPDGFRWRTLADRAVITKGGFDSHNLAFWDPLRGGYVCFLRDNTGGLRRIATCTSEDFVHWTEPRLIEYADERLEQMYTNAIAPYPRAPHIYIGTPARLLCQRKKVPAHPHPAISDAVLVSSRDGVHFERWEEGFIRPGPEPEVWTDRNNYPAWGMLQLCPEELSIYWSEHNKHPVKRMRRGTLRTDGFVSVHAGGRLGELLTRPLVFDGNVLDVNYATSAAGTLRFALCDIDGRAFDGYDLPDAEVLYGNELAHTVRWYPKSDLAQFAGRPVRLRVRMQDADLYSFRFQ